MATAERLPLHPSTAHNAAKTIEETYQKKTQLEHILLRPDTYIGSVEKHTKSLWVCDDADATQMALRSVTYVPGLYKIFDEILVNAADNKQRDPSMDAVKVVIDPDQNLISVFNNGDGVPVEVHRDEGVYVPELIFGHLLTSSNYDDDVKKTTGGRNGYGAKLANIFSTEFVIETADGRRQKKYKQVFANNMGNKTEPAINKCKAGENWTKVTFKPDLAKFKMTHLEDDVVALMKKRVIDLAGTLGKSVKVELNGKRIPVKSFADYVDLYLQSASKSRSDSLPRMVERVNGRWEVCVSLSEGQFQQVSFANGISTIKGGTHVDYITNQITSYVINIVNKKKKNANLKAHTVKNHLWVFVNALIDNPAFDSQTKETLTTRQSSFGSKCELSQEFLKKVAKSGVVDNLLTWADFKQNKDLKKTDGAKRQRITGITKLEDANDAGGRYSDKCTLILTEGDSAKALAMAGISVVGRNHYGVFPLRGKLLNVREATHKQIMENAEIQSIKQILGLQHGKEYDCVKSLRYGHLMIMTDQDHDGSHIKGLLINFIHNFWPSLLRIPSFMVEFITPIVKATHNKNGKVLSFYTMPEYESWKDRLGGNASGWSIKYYKGLGTSTSKEGKEYFRDLYKHRKDFVWVDEKDNDAIELAFSKKKIDDRKNWLRQFEPGTYLDQKEKLIKYSDFVNKELILFSMADLQRSIPSMVDGLKPGQRKILFCSFKRNFVKEAKVAQFSGYVSEHSAYHHGEQSLASTIIGMAQDFVGSNNINLLQPNGQFGTRNQGGKDHASARYIYTKLSNLTRFLFPKDDDILLDYLREDGQSIEPVWYMPILPMVLVNGSEGIGTGWSSYIPNYNPRDIVANIRRLLNEELMEPMDPWFKGFKGVIDMSATKETGVTYTISGMIEEVNGTMLRIIELPIRKWTQDYKEFLEAIMTGSEKIKEPFISDYREHNDDTSVNFEVFLPEENLNIARQDGLLKKFKLTTTISTSNMHLFDAKGVIKKYDSPEQILVEFFYLRLEFYEKRKRVLLDNLELDLLKLDNKVRFILGVVKGEIIVNNRRRADLFLELHQKRFTPFPKKNKGIDAAVAGAAVEPDDNEEGTEFNDAGVKASDYEYLLSMPIGSLTLEKVQELCAEKSKLENEVQVLGAATAKSLWLKDLDAFENEYSKFEKEDAEAEEQKKRMRLKDNTVKGAPKTAPKIPRNKATNGKKQPVDAVVSTATSLEESKVSETTKVAAKGRAKKAPAKTKVIESDDEEEELLELKERLARYNLNSSSSSSSSSSSVQTEGEVDDASETTKKEPKKRTAAGKTASTSIEVVDAGDDAMPTILEGEVLNTAAAPKGRKAGGGRKATEAAAAERRGVDQNDKSDAATKEAAAVATSSPEKKVRRMRASPFNKKSGSVLDKMIGGDSPTETETPVEEEAAPTRTRPRRANRRRVTYVVSDSESEVDVNESEVEISDDSSDSDEDY